MSERTRNVTSIMISDAYDRIYENTKRYEQIKTMIENSLS
jgi:hypothetical protein